MMRLHNTLTRKTEAFTPQEDKTVALYTCGPTVYSEPHIGNWVSYIRWDILVRVLLASGYKINRVMNITDVGHLTSDADEGEDKMQKGARREGITEWEVAERYTNQFIEGMKKLNILPPEHLTKATDHIDIQIKLIQKLQDKGFTYVLEDGVYFDTALFPSYADFAHLDLDALRAGARVEFNKSKHNNSDFVLWRFTPRGETRNMEWGSPWGRGIPGWHIECSAMAMRYLGDTLDIHTGGIDHIPVHHTNEIAQSEAATGKRFSRFWLHNSHLLSNGTKLAKSLNNSFTLDDLATKGFSPMDFRMFILQSHYRTETNFTWDNLDAARNRLKRWSEIACLRWQTANSQDKTSDIDQIVKTAEQEALKALQDDLNTPVALVAIEKALEAIDSSNPRLISNIGIFNLIEWVDMQFGLSIAGDTPNISDEIKALIAQRDKVRAQKNWESSDSIRDNLLKLGVVVRDKEDQTLWAWA